MIDVLTNCVATAVEYAAVALGLAGNLLVAHKRRSGFALWIVSNFLLVPLVLSKAMYGLGVLYVTYSALAMYSFWRWRRDAPRIVVHAGNSADDTNPQLREHSHKRDPQRQHRTADHPRDAKQMQRAIAIAITTLCGLLTHTHANGQGFTVAVQGQQVTVGSTDRIHGYRYATNSNCTFVAGTRVQCESVVDLATPVGNDRNPSPNAGCVRVPILVWNNSTASYATSGDTLALTVICPVGTTFRYTTGIPYTLASPGGIRIAAADIVAPMTLFVEVEVCKQAVGCDNLAWAIPVSSAANPVVAPSACELLVPRTTINTGDTITATLSGCNNAPEAVVLWYLDGRLIAGGLGATSVAVSPFAATSAATARALLQADICIPGACQLVPPQVMFALQGAPATTGCFDLDGDGKQLAATDGLMLARTMLGFSGAAITLHAIAPGAPRADWTAIRQHLLNCGAPWLQ